YVNEGEITDVYVIAPHASISGYSATISRSGLVTPLPEQVFGSLAASSTGPAAASSDSTYFGDASGPGNAATDTYPNPFARSATVLHVAGGPFASNILIQISIPGQKIPRLYPIAVHPLYRFAARLGMLTSSLANPTFTRVGNNFVQTAAGNH